MPRFGTIYFKELRYQLFPVTVFVNKLLVSKSILRQAVIASPLRRLDTNVVKLFLQIRLKHKCDCHNLNTYPAPFQYIMCPTTCLDSHV